MSAVAELMEATRAAGADLRLNGDRVRVRTTKPLPPDLLAEIRTHKADLLAELRGRDAALLARCRDACKGLSLWPQELAANLTPEDREAILSGDPAELGALRCMAEGLAERLITGELPPHLHEAYARLRKELAEHPGLKFACETLTPDADPILMAVAVRGAGFCTMRMAKANYSEGKLLELVHRWNNVESKAC